MKIFKQNLPKFIKQLSLLGSIIYFSACTTNEPAACLVNNDFVGLWKTQRVIKNNENLSKRQQWRFLELLDNGQFIMETRKPTNMTATSGMEDNKRVFYDWNTEYRVKNSFMGNWLFCTQNKTLQLDATQFKQSKKTAIVDSLKSFSIQVQNQTKDSLNVTFNETQVLLIKAK